jgi:hypothetical protein
MRGNISLRLELPGAFFYNLPMKNFRPKNISIYREDDSKFRLEEKYENRNVFYTLHVLDEI